MKRFAPTGLLLVRLLSSPWSLVAFVAIVSAFWLPYVHHSSTPELIGAGVVQRSERSEVDVVLLDSGVYTTLDEDGSLSPGTRVEVYDAPWLSPASSSSGLGLWALTVLLGVLGALLSALVLGFLGTAALEAAESRLERLLRSR